MWELWRSELRNKHFVFHCVVTLIGVLAFAFTLPYFFIEILLPKPGVQVNDFILNLFTPANWSFEIFVFLYLSTILSVAFNFTKPRTVLIAFQVYVVVNFMRMVTMYCFTLEAPQGIIPLIDPITASLAYGQPVYIKDLFFSGHVSTMCIFFFIEKRKFLKPFFLVSTVLVAAFLAWQRVHYSFDIIVAPLVTWAVFAFFKWFDARFIYSKSDTEN